MGLFGLGKPVPAVPKLSANTTVNIQSGGLCVPSQFTGYGGSFAHPENIIMHEAHQLNPDVQAVVTIQNNGITGIQMVNNGTTTHVISGTVIDKIMRTNGGWGYIYLSPGAVFISNQTTGSFGSIPPTAKPAMTEAIRAARERFPDVFEDK